MRYVHVAVVIYIRNRELILEQYRLTLDGRVLRTPARNPLLFPNKLLAVAVAAEWDAQTDDRKGLEPITMPLTTIASTAIDQVLPSMEDVRRNCLRYLPTDSALYFTSEDDRILYAQQRKHLSPVIRQLNRLLLTDLEPTQVVSRRIEHSPETIKTFEDVVGRLVSEKEKS